MDRRSRNLFNKVRKLRLQYEDYEKQLNGTPHNDHKKVVYLLQKIEKVSFELDLNYEKIEKELADNLYAMELSQGIFEVKKEIDVGIVNFSVRFLDRATNLARIMIRHNVRGPELNQLFEAMKKLGFNIGKLEEEAGGLLKRERKIKSISSITSACIYINEVLSKHMQDESRKFGYSY